MRRLPLLPVDCVGTGRSYGLAHVKVFSEASAQQMWTPVVPTPTPKWPGKLADAAPKFSAYALGWSVRDYRGEKVIEHGGAIFGVYTYIALFPDRNFGVALQMNSEDVQAMRGIALELMDHYLGAPKSDWVAAFDGFLDQRMEGGLAALDAAAKAAPVVQGKPSLLQASYAGRYADPWYGPIDIRNESGRLRDFKQTPGMVGTLEHWRYDTFQARWDDRTIEPAYVSFALDAQGQVDRITMKAVSRWRISVTTIMTCCSRRSAAIDSGAGGATQ